MPGPHPCARTRRVRSPLTLRRVRQASGVNVNDACIQAYNDLKTARKSKYIFFQLSADFKEIVVDQERLGAPTATYNDFVAVIKALPKEECRYAVYDFEWETADGGKRQKIVFYAWYALAHASPCRPLSLFLCEPRATGAPMV
jgi:hypothetical protein